MAHSAMRQAMLTVLRVTQDEALARKIEEADPALHKAISDLTAERRKLQREQKIDEYLAGLTRVDLDYIQVAARRACARLFVRENEVAIAYHQFELVGYDRLNISVPFCLSGSGDEWNNIHEDEDEDEDSPYNVFPTCLEHWSRLPHNIPDEKYFEDYDFSYDQHDVRMAESYSDCDKAVAFFEAHLYWKKLLRPLNGAYLVFCTYSFAVGVVTYKDDRVVAPFAELGHPFLDFAKDNELLIANGAEGQMVPIQKLGDFYQDLAKPLDQVKSTLALARDLERIALDHNHYALRAACACGNLEVVRWLVERFQLESYGDCVPFYLACLGGHLDVARFWLALGGSFAKSLRDAAEEAKTVAKVCRRRGHDALAALIRSAVR